jgi:hypothetical protein
LCEALTKAEGSPRASTGEESECNEQGHILGSAAADCANYSQSAGIDQAGFAAKFVHDPDANNDTNNRTGLNRISRLRQGSCQQTCLIDS